MSSLTHFSPPFSLPLPTPQALSPLSQELSLLTLDKAGQNQGVEGSVTFFLSCQKCAVPLACC